jgi:hypothetical protein
VQRERDGQNGRADIFDSGTGQPGVKENPGLKA